VIRQQDTDRQVHAVDQTDRQGDEAAAERQTHLGPERVGLGLSVCGCDLGHEPVQRALAAAVLAVRAALGRRLLEGRARLVHRVVRQVHAHVADVLQPAQRVSTAHSQADGRTYLGGGLGVLLRAHAHQSVAEQVHPAHSHSELVNRQTDGWMVGRTDIVSYLKGRTEVTTQSAPTQVSDSISSQAHNTYIFGGQT